MARLGLFCSGALIAGLVACSVERPGESSAQSATHAEAQKAPAAQPKAPLPPVKAPTPPAPATKTVKAPPPARHDSGHGGANAAKWAGDVEWTTWEAGMAKAKAEGKPACLVVYADWCPKCRTLAPALSTDPEIAALSKEVVMIRQNSDERPTWLGTRFGQYGGYVPRVFLIGADGEIKEDMTSGHPRYPYFYTPSGSFGLDALKANLKKLTAG